MSSSLVPLKLPRGEGMMYEKSVEAQTPPVGLVSKLVRRDIYQLKCRPHPLTMRNQGRSTDIHPFTHSKSSNRTDPRVSAADVCMMSLLMLCTSDIYALINYLSFAQWLWTGLVILGLMVLRIRQPDLHRPIKVSLFCPIVFFLCCIFLTIVPMFAEPFETGMVLLVMLAGLPVYLVFFYGSKRYLTPKDSMSEKVTKFLQKVLEVVTPGEKFS
ncbi:hypothetical protein TNCV_36001 [Trichonephila clavipes]|nr:hypothetical protein TNCV_36001 [Trichonephila clavipes]